MKRKQKKLKEKVFEMLVKVFVILLMGSFFGVMFAYGLLHATTLN